MRKKYIKPYLAVEPYQLDASVAAACSTENKIPIYYSDYNCFHPGSFSFATQCDNNVVDPGPGQGDVPCTHGVYGPAGLAFTYS